MSSRITELEKELFKQSQESKDAVSRAIEIILEKDDKIAELEKRIVRVTRVRKQFEALKGQVK